MIVCIPIVVVYIGSYYIVNMMHAIDIWMFMLHILGVLIGCGNRLNIGMGASTYNNYPIYFLHSC
jgi:hypothetical protein